MRIASVLVAMLLLSGCGKKPVQEEVVSTPSSGDSTATSKTESTTKAEKPCKNGKCPPPKK